LTRERLVRYGQREDVRRNLLANQQTGGWAGSSVAHYQQKKTALLDRNRVEDNENVRRWLDEYIDELNQLVEHFTIVEERDDFHNPPV
jgi:hypothetical protein